MYIRKEARISPHGFAGSTGSSPLRRAGKAAGLEACPTVTHLESLGPARACHRPSISSRCPVGDRLERISAGHSLSEHAVSGRPGYSRPANIPPPAVIAGLAPGLNEASATRSGGPGRNPADPDRPQAGVVPVVRTHGAPVPADCFDPPVNAPECFIQAG
ncbi:hypothetical protein [Streptomyces sp. NPDC058964]|uniref:hypothetical protein n=1 Tax=Streptomyces sp. NPDC058964 TaxID=3346681 RepID=UPI0036CDEF1A